MNISIHALLAESDQQPNNQEHPSSLFLSTLSLRRATKLQDCRNSQNIISIHALLAESDLSRFAVPQRRNLFLSTLSLRRATLKAYADCNAPLKFLSTLSLRRATTHPIGVPVRVIISIHALLAESDGILSIRIIGFLGFLSTLSLRRATETFC